MSGSGSGLSGPEREERLRKLREMIRMVEDGEIEGIPSREETVRALREEMAAVSQGGGSRGEPGVLVVGQPFDGVVPAGTIGFYPEGIPMMLVMGMDSPSPEDLATFHTTEKYIEFALVPLGPLLATLVRFPSKRVTEKAMWGLWMDAPWAHREDSAFDLGEAPGPGEERYGVSACLVDSDTGLVTGMRFFTLSPHYSRIFHRELAARLAEPPISREEFIRLAFEYQTRYRDPKQMIDRAIARCKAGLP